MHHPFYADHVDKFFLLTPLEPMEIMAPVMEGLFQAPPPPQFWGAPVIPPPP